MLKPPLTVWNENQSPRRASSPNQFSAGILTLFASAVQVVPISHVANVSASTLTIKLSPVAALSPCQQVGGIRNTGTVPMNMVKGVDTFPAAGAPTGINEVTLYVVGVVKVIVN